MSAARTILLLRPEPEAAAFADALEARLPGRFRAVAAPPFVIENRSAAIDLDGVQCFAFTSAHAVRGFDMPAGPPSLPAWCVGSATAAAARAAGFVAISADGDAAALVRLIAGAWQPSGGDVLYLRGAHVAGDLAGQLRTCGVAVREAVVYDQPARPLPEPARALLAAGAADVVAIFSARGARLFAAAAESAGWPLGTSVVVAISTAADAALGGLGVARRVVAERPDRYGMLEALATI